MASIKLLKNGTYEIAVSDGEGGRVYDYFTPDPKMSKRKSEKALEEFKVIFESNVRSGLYKRDSNMKVKQLSKLYLESLETDMQCGTISPTTYYSYKQYLNLRIVPLLGNVSVNQLTQARINKFKKKLMEDGIRSDGKPGGYSQASITKNVAVISAMLSFAVGENIININPLIYAGKVKRKKINIEEYPIQCFTAEEALLFLQVLDMEIPVSYHTHSRKNGNGHQYSISEYTQTKSISTKWKLYFYIALFLGDRRGEQVSLKWSDFNFDDNSIAINKSTVYVNKEIIHKSTKTYKHRTNIVPEFVMKLAKQWKNEQQLESIKMGDQWLGSSTSNFDNNYVFTQANGKQMSLSSGYHMLQKIIVRYNSYAINEGLDVLPKITLHALRHTAASLLVSSKIDVRSLADFLGHADPNTSLKFYVHKVKKANSSSAILGNMLLNKNS